MDHERQSEPDELPPGDPRADLPLEHLRNLLAEMADGVVLLDRDGRVRYANAAAERLLGAAGTLLGAPFSHSVVVDSTVEVVVEEGAGGVRRVELRAARSRAAGDGSHVVCVRDATHRLAAEQSLRDSVWRLSDTLESISDGFFALDDDWRVTYFNRAAEDLVGRRREEVLGRHLMDAFPEARGSLFEEKYAQALRSKEKLHFEVFFDRPPYRNWYEVRVYPRSAGISVYFQVTTERKQAEEERRKFDSRLQQAQKLESLGVLAGGIAHDFNNLLMGILGHADLALLELSPVAPVRENLEQIVAAARSAADLTRQMLAYSGRGSYLLQRVDLSLLVEEMTHLLLVSISKKAVLKFACEPHLPPVEADPAQLRQVVMNLVVNASEAIGDKSGVISVHTGVMHCDRAYLAEAYLDDHLPEGRYVFLEVADNGCGMPADVRARIFEPFYTTKFTGRGMGLAAVLGIVRSLSGAIKVYSEEGHGTTVKVLWPALDERSAAADADAPDERAWRGHGTLLLVDDEEGVRQVARQMLEKLGFTVLAAGDGRQALEIFRQHQHQIVAVLLDMTMPHLSGEETFRDLRRVQSDVRVILSSGYSQEDATQHFSGKGLAGFLQKPYRSAELARVLRSVLGDTVG